MLGTALQFGGVRSDDRFYIPVKARKSQNQSKQAQRTKGGGETDSADSASKSKLAASENRNLSDESSYPLNIPPSSCPSVDPASNIDRFIESTTPLVPAQYFSKVDLTFPLCKVVSILFFYFIIYLFFCFVRLGRVQQPPFTVVLFSVCNCWCGILNLTEQLNSFGHKSDYECHCLFIQLLAC